jgi:penicillin-binding protein 1B
VTPLPYLRALWRPRRLRLLALLLLLALALFVLYLDHVVRSEFEGKRWALPARVYARPLELFPGEKLSPAQLLAELALLNYRSDNTPPAPGSYRRSGDEFDLLTRAFVFSDGPQPPMDLHLEFRGDHLDAIRDMVSGDAVTQARLDPLRIGSIYPSHNEDRVLVKLDEAPPALINALVAVEDHKFYTHHGIDPRGIARALKATVSGGAIQGGSTLTQQLVKNFFLSPERTLRRKFTEILMALLLELHYDKQEILEAYLNEIYLGQDGDRAVHGFGLASQFYFGRPLAQLDVPQAALLVGMVKGPSLYDPRRNPARARERRNLVLAELARQNFISQAQYTAAKDTPLGVASKPPGGNTPYPAFLDLVHRQLRRDYREEDLRSEGLNIFTTLDPQAQAQAERALAARLPTLEKGRGLARDSLEGAVIVTNTQNGEVQAVVGGRDPRYAGFNRALDAQRPIGSLIKPAVYLTALERPARYTLATLLDDSPLVWHERGTDDWTPNNYDKEFHGNVPLRVALANSYNVATARLGLSLGIGQVLDTVRLLGVERELHAYASSLLGANELSPLEVVQMYQTLASGGFQTPPRAIREILTSAGQPLQRYPLSVAQTVDPAPAYLVTTAMQGVVQDGTAKGLAQFLPPALHLAGKTGTTDDLKDSWFAGFSGDRLAVVWVGTDNNRTTHLTGASGAMTIWGDMMSRLDPEPLQPPPPENIERVWIDSPSGLRADSTCDGAVELPFIRGSAPTETAPCVSHSPVKAVKSWFKRLFEK